jgi:serine/threonine protein kinase
MAAAHSNPYIDEVGFQATGVLHGDIKPANILVRPDDSPVLLDFMMADLQRLLDARWQPADTRDFERRTWAYGTPGYMAPEQEEQGIVRFTTDVYGLGITLIRVFFPQKFGEVEGRPVWPTALRREEDGLNGLRYLLGQMVHHFPEERPSSMREVSERLDEIARENSCQLT